VSSSIETQPLTPPQPVDQVWTFTDDPAVARRAVFILAETLELQAAQQLHQRIVLGAFVAMLVLVVLGAVSGVTSLFGLAAAALLVAVVGWALWFTRWE
jgi:hypothetical protein